MKIASLLRFLACTDRISDRQGLQVMSQVMLTGRDSQREFCLRENAAAELRRVGTRFAIDLRHRLAKELVNEGADSRLLRR